MLPRGTERGYPPLRRRGDHEDGSGQPVPIIRKTTRLRRVGTRIVMDGKGRCIDNLLIESLWRSLKYECVELHGLGDTGWQAEAAIGLLQSSWGRARPMAGCHPLWAIRHVAIWTGQRL